MKHSVQSPRQRLQNHLKAHTLNNKLRAFTLLLSCALLANNSLADAPLSGASLFAHVEKYASLGEHRTGTPADHATSAWLSAELKNAGFSLQQQSFSVSQFFPKQQQLSIGKQAYKVFPHWLPAITKADIKAPLAPLSSTSLQGKIAYLSPDNAGLWYQLKPAELAQQAHQKGALALLIAVPHPSQEIYASNAEPPHLDQPIALPTVIIAAKYHRDINKAMQQQKTVRLISKGQISPAEGRNVLARYPEKTIANAPWVIISTPSSGWFQCAGERGSGVALWLDMARHLSRQQTTSLNWLFIANSGHELNMIGAEHSLNITPKPKQVKLWLHLGASIAARQWHETATGIKPTNKVHAYNRFYSAGSLLTLFQYSLADIDDLSLLPIEQLNRSTSELGKIAMRGYPAAGIVGSHRFFHTPGDTPAVTSSELLAPYGEAMQRLIEQLQKTQL